MVESARNFLAQLQLCLDYEMLSWRVGKREIPSGEFQDTTSSSLSAYPCSLELRQPAQEKIVSENHEKHKEDELIWKIGIKTRVAAALHY